MSKPLEGIKIVEVAIWVFAPSAAGMLSDLGAEVIKIEPPSGDPVRGLTASGMKPGAVDGFSPYWEICNRGKKSLTLDLNEPRGMEVLHKLLEDADVFLTNFLPDARRRLKIDVEDIQGRHPNVVYALGAGHGVRGPDAEKGGFDMISYWSRSGMAWGATPKSEPYPLSMPSGAFGDLTSGGLFAGGIAMGLLQRERTGKAPVVDASLLAAGLWSMQASVTICMMQGVADMPARGHEDPFNPVNNFYRTSDGRFVMLSMLQSQRYWPGLCAALGRPDLTEDRRFATDEARRANVARTVKVLDEVFATRTLAEWEQILATQEGPWGVVARPGEVHTDAQVQANGYIQKIDYGDGRTLHMVAAPFQFDREPAPARAAPALGAHSDEILAGLGYDEDQIIELKVAGVVF